MSGPLRSVCGVAGRLALSAALLPLGLRAEQCKAPPELEARTQTNATADAYTDVGTWFGQQGQFACANQAFRSALQLDPNSAKVNYFLAFSLYSSGDKQGALAPLERSSQLDPQALQPRLLAASTLEELNRPKDAEAQWKAALALDPASTDALDGLAKNLVAAHEYFAAINLLRTAARDEALTLDLVTAYGLAGQLEDAGAVAKESLAANPGSKPLTKALATVYVHQHRYQDAMVLWREYLGKTPDDQEAQIQYLSALVLTHDEAAARPLGQKLLGVAPHDFQVLYLNGILEREAEEYPAAREHLREAVGLRPEDYTARYNLGATLAHLADAKGAKEQLEEAIALDPTQAEAHFQLAGVLKTIGDAAGAQKEIALFQQLKKSSAARAEADTAAQQAREKMAAGDTAGAVELYRQAVAATPENALLQFHFALALDETKDLVAERAALEKAVQIDPTFALAENQMGYLASRGGDLKTAEASFRRVVAEAPEFVEGWISLAATLASESKFGEAQEAVATALRLDPNSQQAKDLSQQLAAAARR